MSAGSTDEHGDATVENLPPMHLVLRTAIPPRFEAHFELAPDGTNDVLELTLQPVGEADGR